MNGEAARTAALKRALRSLEGLSVGDAFGERLMAEPTGVLTAVEQRRVLAGPWPYTDDTVMAMAMPKLLANIRQMDGSRLAKTYVQASSVNGRGRNVSCTESGSVLNEVTTDHANGMHIRTA